MLDKRFHPPTTGETTALLATGPPPILLGDLYDGSHIILAMDLLQCLFQIGVQTVSK